MCAHESLWAKGQKDAIAELRRFAQTRDPGDYARYERAIAVPLGDHRARLALEQPQLDWNAASEGLLAGGNHPDDIARMIRLIRWGRWSLMSNEALRIWTDADVGICAPSSSPRIFASRCDERRGTFRPSSTN